MKRIALFLAAMLAVAACGNKIEPEEGGQKPGTGNENGAQTPGSKPELEGNIRGQITDSKTGAPIAGVSVSDGYTVTVTDADGNYAFYGNELTRTVFISVPAEYEIPTDKDGHPAFYTNGQFNDPQKEYAVSFKLTPREKVSEKFILCAAADVHIYDGTDKNYPKNRRSDLTQFKEDCLPDMLNTMEGLNGGGSYNDCLVLFAGDQMSDNMEQVVPFKNTLANKTVNGQKLAFLHCIGNHDFANRDLANKEATSYNASKTFVENFGPMDYSLNIGNAHIVVMNNMIVNSKDNLTRDGQVQCVGYGKGITDEQLEWLKQDLACVKNPEKKVIILCVHVPIYNDNSQNYQQVVKLMGDFNEGHIVSGHSHNIKNYIHKQTCKNGKGIYEHNLQSLAGDWWFSNLSSDGSPRGYKVLRFSGNKLFDSVNKAVGASSNYQMRVYNGNDSYSGTTKNGGTPAKGTLPKYDTYTWGDSHKGHFLVRVWNADENWSVSFVQNGVATEMTRLSSIVDQCTQAFGCNFQKNIYGASFSHKTDNFWTIEAPCGDPAKESGWKIVATHKYSSGLSKTYECNIIQSDYTGFASGDKFPENN